jgi:hypothetical protein
MYTPARRSGLPGLTYARDEFETGSDHLRLLK